MLNALPICCILLLANIAYAEPIDKAGWLSGCWQSQSQPSTRTIEIWTQPQGGIMFGLGYTLRDDAVVNHETLRIESVPDATGNAVLQYVALPSGQTLTRFQATQISDNRLVFSNPSHDFPQHISYQLTDNQQLIARAATGEQGFELRFTKISCDTLIKSNQALEAK
ncbi:hypothetical protein M5M_05235 [Simiduia agarivorans SA1 = DSM 21679]|uniref:DUF6265 domain-containing protein n=2 Tax=Simiduia TaxID=447467 RepID=K4KWG0_SIMAS|nr:hypothetical protein M5M_05235 [Simiduia agarivorans SA1 = DSM 21679]